MSRILFVDDDAAVRTVVAQALRRGGDEVAVAPDLAQFRRLIAGGLPDLVVTDVVLPDGDGIDAMRDLRVRHPELPVIVVSARNTLTTAVRAAELGAYEYLPKPFDLDALARAVAGALMRGPAAVNATEPEDAALPLIGRSPAMQEVYRTIARVVATDLTVLVAGESGTGKELVARAIHDLGRRAGQPFVAINMAAIPRELIEAELFGHERGAFTGAAQRHAGRFEQANDGTLFLDEIGDMPLEAQTRLLRVLQTGEFTTVGGARTIRTNVRIVAASHRDLGALVATGQFREDLFYRLAVVPVTLPPLRERGDDIGLLTHHFLDAAVIEGLPRRTLSDDAVAALLAHDWPGNVRELENLVRRLAVLGRDEVIDAAAVHAALGSRRSLATEQAESVTMTDAVRQIVEQLARERPAALEDGSLYELVIAGVERPLIEIMLARHGHNQLRAARALGLNRNTLRKRLDQLGITVGTDRT